jgi:hypothetical protein
MSSNTKPIGVAYEDQNIVGSDLILSGDELGYTAEAQGTVTQLTDKATAVTLNRSMGRITTSNAALGATTSVTFTFNNSKLSPNDVIVLNVNGGTTGAYNVYTSVLGSGSASITLRNITGGSLSEALVLNYAVIHGP